MKCIQEVLDSVVVIGCQNFYGNRLHVLQIGLGTYGTVLQNLTLSSEEHRGVSRLLEGVSDATESIRCVSVEPVPEHVVNLKPTLEILKNSTLVQAAIVQQRGMTKVHVIDPKEYKACLQKIPPGDITDLENRFLYLNNMSWAPKSIY